MEVTFSREDEVIVRDKDGQVMGKIIYRDNQYVFNGMLAWATYWDLEMISHQLRVMNGAVQ